jgi:hypothetical protein
MRKLLLLMLLFVPSLVHAQATQIASGPNDPATCEPTIGQIFYNTTTKILKYCSATNTWAVVTNLNGVITVDGVTYARTDAGIQAAVNAAEVLGGGSTVFLPAGTYLLKSSLPITISSRVNIIGSGWGTFLSVDPSVGATTDIFLIQPTGNRTISGCRFQDFFISPASGTPARHAFNLNGANGEIVDFIFDHVIVQQKLGGNAINASGSGLAQGTPVLTTIQNSVLYGGIVMSSAGDTIRILNNQITGAGPAIDVSFQSGASTFIVSGNNITSDGGIHLGTSVISAQIFNNEIETFKTFTGSSGALIDIDGPSSTAADVAVAWNSLQVVNRITANGIRVNNANRTHIFGNRFGRGAGASVDIRVTPSAHDTFIGTNLWVAGGPFSSMVSDSGTGTVLATEFGNALVLANARPLAGLDDAGTQRSLLQMNPDGSVTLFGYHGNNLATGVNGASYIYDGFSGANVVAAFSNQSSTFPGTRGVVSSAAFGTRNANPAQSGLFRLASSDTACWRNNGNSADVCISKNASDQFLLNGTLATQTIAGGTVTLGTSSISSGSCAFPVTVSATGVATTDAISWSFNADPSGVSGYGSGTTGTLSVWAFPTANNVNFRVCNLTGGAITPGAATLNWRVVR